MGGSSSVPMYDPTGKLRDVPFSVLKDAVANGGVPAHAVKAPDGTIRMVPVTRLKEAVDNGGTIQPLKSDEGHLPTAYGFTLSNLASNAWEGAKSVVKGTAAVASDLANNPNWIEGPNSTLNKFVFKPADAEADKAKELWNQGRYSEALGHGLAAGVPLVGPAAAQLGEQAGTGDVGGALAKGAGMVAGAKAVEVGSKAVKAAPETIAQIAESPSIRAGVKAAAKTLPAAAVRRLPYVGEVAADVYKAGTEAAAKAKGTAAAPAPEPDATGENKDFAGEPPPKPAKTLDATGENKPFAGGMDEYVPRKPRTIVTDPTTGRPEFSDVVEAKQQAAAPSPAAPAAEPAPAAQPAAGAAEPGPAATSPGKGAQTESGPSAADLLDRLQGIAGRISKQEAAAPGAADEDLTQQLQDSLDLIRARKAVAGGNVAQNAPPGASGSISEAPNGVLTTRAPKELLDRWGVDEDSFAAGREQTRGMKPDESAAAVAHLKKAYQNGQAVAPVMETRDADNNIIDVDGRGRALAAHQAGVEQIPIVVRRMAPVSPAAVPTQ
jgi:hypothetical protein